MAANHKTLRDVERAMIARGDFRTRTAVAEAVGMSVSGFSRAIRNAGTMKIDNCLRFAEVARVDATWVLRLAKKPVTADLIERLYGTPTQDTVNLQDLEFIHLWRDVDPDAREAIYVLLRALTNESVATKLRNRSAS